MRDRYLSSLLSTPLPQLVATLMSSTDDSSLALYKLKEKALHALCSLKKTRKSQQITPIASKYNFRRNNHPSFDI